MDKLCPLCNLQASIYYEENQNRFYLCSCCKAVFRDPDQLPSSPLEKERYKLHQNSLNDIGYHNFVSPLLERIQSETTTGKKGLDFGCGHTPVISEILKQNQYKIDLYDPFFFPKLKTENDIYDFIICCEVIEHFHRPSSEFLTLFELLKEGGKLFCHTSLYSEKIDFGSWYYKNDITHVFFYQVETLEYIRDEFHFSSVKIEDRVITFLK